MIRRFIDPWLKPSQNGILTTYYYKKQRKPEINVLAHNETIHFEPIIINRYHYQHLVNVNNLI